MRQKRKKASSKIDINFEKVVHDDQTFDRIQPSGNIGIDKQKDVLGEMANQLNEICSRLNSNGCKIEEVYDLLKDYDRKYHRVLYSAVSDYVFDAMNNANLKKGEDQSILLQYKVSDLVSFADGQKDEELKKTAIKLYDHINLATRQYRTLKQSEDEYRSKFKANIEPVKNELIRESNSQLLTLVGIFTALAFLIFGGISSLDNLFSEMNQLPMLKLIALGCVWGMCILNLVFIFLVCVGRMTHLPFSFSDKPDADIREKYAVVWLSNLILLMLLIFSVGILYMDKYELDQWFVNWSKSNPVLFSLLFILFLALLLGGGIYLIFHKKKD